MKRSLSDLLIVVFFQGFMISYEAENAVCDMLIYFYLQDAIYRLNL